MSKRLVGNFGCRNESPMMVAAIFVGEHLEAVDLSSYVGTIPTWLASDILA